MSDFPFVKGDKVRLPGWGPGLAVLITAVGEEQFLGRYGKDDAETAFLIPSWFGQSWERYIEPPTKPERLNEEWVNVYSSFKSGYTVQDADENAGPNRIGRLNLGTGEWVPCNGQQVLA